MTVTANSIITPQAIRSLNCVTTAAKTTLSDATNAVKLGDAGANGSILRKLTAMPRATVTATQLQLYKFDGAAYWLVGSVLMPAYTMANTTADPITDFGYSDWDDWEDSQPD